MRFWRRTPRRTVAAGFVLLALGVAAITGLGVTLTPTYGNLTPYGEAGVVDVRTAPYPVGWKTDLARDVLPGVPVRCVSLSESASSGRYVLLTGAQQPLGSTKDCTSLTANQVQSTIALLDATTGRVLWTKDLRRVYPDNTGSVIPQNGTISLAAKTVVVQSLVGSVNGVTGLSIATGKVTGAIEHASDVTGQTPDVAGGAVLYASGVSRQGATMWTLARANRLDVALWSAILPDSDAPRMTDRAVFTTIQNRSTRIDAATGSVSDLGGGSIDLSNSVEDDDGLFTTQSVQSGTVVTAWDADGKRLWSRSGVGDLSGTSRDCVVVALPGTTKLTCLDRSTGIRRWTTDIGSLAFATGMTGQTTNDIAVYRSRANGLEIVVLNGDTGQEEFILPLEAQSALLAVSRTTGYLRTSSATGTSTGIIAFDMRTGRTLWTRITQTNGDTELWGGHLVSISATHVARELGEEAPMILGG